MKRQVVTLALLAGLLTAVNLGRAADDKAPNPDTTAPARNRERVQQRLKELSPKPVVHLAKGRRARRWR